jgi:cytochrome c556
MIMYGVAAGAVAAALMLSVAAHEHHHHATGVVKERMVAMESMGKHWKAITDRVKDERDLAAIKADAAAIAELASHVAHLFPPGSTQHPTQARSTIWQNWPDFERRARTLETVSGKLAATDPGDAAAVAAQARALSQVCGGCHEKYRVRK